MRCHYTKLHIIDFHLLDLRTRIEKYVFVPSYNNLKKLARGHVKDIGSTVGIQSYRGQGYEGAMSGNFFANSRHLHLYVMDVLSGARVGRVRWVWEAAPC